MIVFRHVNGWKPDVQVAAKRDESVPKVVMMFKF